MSPMDHDSMPMLPPFTLKNFKSWGTVQLACVDWVQLTVCYAGNHQGDGERLSQPQQFGRFWIWT